MPVHLQNFFYYPAILVLVVGSIVGVAFALRTRREAREGVSFTSEAEMLSEFQRARDAGEMDEAEFRRVRDLLIAGKNSREGEQRDIRPNTGFEDLPAAYPPPAPPTPTDLE